jgi:hypothetical protein
MDTQPGKPRVVIFSLRNIFKAFFRCPHYEFEDIICEIDSSVLLAPEVDPSSMRFTLAGRLGPAAASSGYACPGAASFSVSGLDRW